MLLSVAYIGHNSRTERPRKTKIGIEVAHVTRDSDTTFKVKRSTSPGKLWLVVVAGQHGHTVMVIYPYVYMMYIVSPLAAHLQLIVHANDLVWQCCGYCGHFLGSTPWR